MLGKLLKYEFKASGRILLPIFAATIILAALFGLSVHFSGVPFMGMPSEAGSIVWRRLYLLLLPTIPLVWFAAVSMAFIFSAIRFEKSLLGKEGYLMNTLPVSTESNIAAKFIVATVYQCAALAVSLIAYGTVFFTANGPDHLVTWLRTLSRLNINDLIDILTFGIIVLLMLTMFNAAIYASLAFGYSFNSKKILLSVAMFVVLFNIGIKILLSVFEPFYNNNYWLLILVEAGLTVVGLAIADVLIKKRLNLE